MVSNERDQRYAGVAIEALELDVRRAHDRMVADDVAARFMAVADAEQAELRAEVAQAWDAGFEAAYDWVGRNPGASGIWSDPPSNPYDAGLGGGA